MKIISLLILPAILLSQTTERSSIGSYWVGLGYDGYSDDLSDADHLFIDSNFPINPNVDIGVAGRIGSVSLPSNDLLSYGVFVDAKVHEKFDLGGISADPYFGVSLGFAALESYSWLYVGSDYYYNYYQTVADTSVLVPYSLFLGSEFAFNSFISIIPAIGVSGILNEDVDTLFNYGLQGNIFFTDTFSLGLAYGADNESGKGFSIIGRYHL